MSIYDPAITERLLAEWDERLTRPVGEALPYRLAAQLAQCEQARKEAIEALDALRKACKDVLLPAIKDAIKRGYKMENWAPAQMQWTKAVELTEAALAAVKGDGHAP